MGTLKKSALVGAAALAMAGATTLFASPAIAASTVGGCTTTLSTHPTGFRQATSLCTQGSGTYRVSVLLAGLSTSGNFAPRNGPIVQVGQPSTVIFNPVARVLSATTQILS